MTTLDIWNMALGFLGTRTVASASENTPEAIQCQLYGTAARQQVLREFPWSFAQRRMRLAPRPVPDVWQGQWTHGYAVPNDCLKVHGVHGGEGRRAPFCLVQGEDRTPCLLTNQAHAMADMTVDVTDASLYDALFAQVLARKLACLVAVPLLKNNSGKVQELEQLYRALLPSAHDATSSEQTPVPHEDAWLAARGEVLC